MTNKTQQLNVVNFAKCGLKNVQNVLAKRKGLKYLRIPKIEKTLIGIMLERFENFGKVECKNTLLGCGLILSAEESRAFGYNFKTPIVFTLNTAICSDRIQILPLCTPEEFIQINK